MWEAVVAAAISAYAQNGGKICMQPLEDDWFAYEKERLDRINRESAATRRMALLGAFLMVLLITFSLCVVLLAWGMKP